MSLSSLVDLPAEPESETCKKSYWILGAAHQTASELLDLSTIQGAKSENQAIRQIRIRTCYDQC
jgi:hypothetical protein